MCIAVIGGMDRLQHHYLEEAARFGIDLRVFNRAETNLHSKLKHVDGLLVFTGKVSHRARNEAFKAAKGQNIPIYQYHSCGVCTLRECLRCLNAADTERPPVRPSGRDLPKAG